MTGKNFGRTLSFAVLAMALSLTACGKRTDRPVPGGPIPKGNKGTVKETPGAKPTNYQGTWQTNCLSTNTESGLPGLSMRRRVEITGDKMVYTLVPYYEPECVEVSVLDSDKVYEWNITVTAEKDGIYTDRIDYLLSAGGEVDFSEWAMKDAAGAYILFDTDVEKYFKR